MQKSYFVCINGIFVVKLQRQRIQLALISVPYINIYLFLSNCSPSSWILTESSYTSNVTSVTKVRSAIAGVTVKDRLSASRAISAARQKKYKRMFVCRYVLPLVSVITTLLCYVMLSHAFSALWVYLKFGHHPHPLGYFCVKFRFFHGLHCWASPWRKIAYSLSLPIWYLGNRSAYASE